MAFYDHEIKSLTYRHELAALPKVSMSISSVSATPMVMLKIFDRLI